MTQQVYQSTDLTVSAIRSRDPLFIIPPDYPEPDPYELIINVDQYFDPLMVDVEALEKALFLSIVPLLQANIDGYEISRPTGCGTTMRGRSEFTLNLARTARQLYTQIERVRNCLRDDPFRVGLYLPLPPSECNDFIYECANVWKEK